jgi:glycine oxidase
VRDVVVVGAGIVGCSSALALAERGLKVTVVDRGRAGAEASSAAAGVVGAQTEATGDGPLARLLVASRERYAPWIAAIERRTGLDVGFRVCGVTHIAPDGAELTRIREGFAWQRALGLRVDELDARGTAEAEPALAPMAGAIRFPDETRVDPPSLVAAVRKAAEAAGAEVLEEAPVGRITVEADRATGVLLEDGRVLEARTVVVAAGSWSALLAGARLEGSALAPARGQMIELSAEPGLLRGVVVGPESYLSPRDDGRILVGTTVENVGFERGTTAGAMAALLTSAVRTVPALAGAAFRRAWSNFRPRTPDEGPLLGRGAVTGLIIATGHFRSGVTLAPITAEIVAALVMGSAPPVDLAAFDPLRRAG